MEVFENLIVLPNLIPTASKINTLQTINFVFSWTRTKKTSYHSSSSGIFSSGGTKQ